MSDRPELDNLIIFVRDLVGDASSDSCDCAQEISDREIISALDNTRERILYNRVIADYNILPGGFIQYHDFRFEPYMDDNLKVVSNGYIPFAPEDFSHFDPLHGRFSTVLSHPIGVFIIGDLFDPHLASANLLRSLRVKKRSLVDTSEMGVSIKLSQALAVMAEVEQSYRQSARIHSITFSRSDIA